MKFKSMFKSLMSQPSSLKKWMKRKSETLDEWLPWAIVIATVSALVLVYFVRSLFSNNLVREPAGFVEISDSEVPAATIYSETQLGKNGTLLKTGSHHGRRNTHQILKSDQEIHPTETIISLPDSPAKQEIERRIGILAKKARAVVFLTSPLVYRTPGQEMYFPLKIFDGTEPQIMLKAISQYEVNAGIHTGRILDDANGKADLKVANGMLSGFIRYKGREYRIVPDSERGVHYIIELAVLTGL